MKIDRLLLHEGLAVIRAAAIAGDQPVALYCEPVAGPPRVRLGERHAARLLARPGDGSGAFAELDSGERAFLRKPPPNLSEGARLDLIIVSEARRDKPARARPAEGGETGGSSDPLNAWALRLAGPGAPDFDTGKAAAEAIDEALSEALSPWVTLEGGGQIQITRTQALTAIDIDTAGRQARGRAHQRAFAINRAAMTAIARQLALRGLGGLGVIDCVAPLTRPQGQALKSAFLCTFRAVSSRRAEALAPSAFGLLEVSLAWGERPVEEVWRDAAGRPTPFGEMLDGLRALEIEAEARRADTLTLALPGAAHHILTAPGSPLADRITARYGTRIKLVASATERIEVY